MEQAGLRHHALIYGGTDAYVAGIVPFVRVALAADQPVLIAVRPIQTRWLEAALGEDRDRVRFLPIEEVGHNPALIISVWRDFVGENAGSPVRGVAEPVWAERSAAALEECHRHEALLNVAFAGAVDFSLLCPYDAASLPGHVLERSAIAHRRLLEKGVSTATPEFDPGRDPFAGSLPSPPVTPEAMSFGLSELAQVRKRVSAAAARAGFDPREAADLVIAASELAANSVVHGGGSGTLRIWRENRCLLVEVEDRGRIHEPLVGRLRPGIAQEGGRGLWLANQLCDLVQIRSGEWGTVVRLHMPAPDRDPGYEAPPAARDPRAAAETTSTA
jgi:anti-sigma regulatory factor (Ser/Thr protein kinase)